MSDHQKSEKAEDHEAALARLDAEDPRLLELLVRGREAFNDLAAYMAVKCEAGGVELPAEWKTLVSGMQKKGAAEQEDKR